MIRKFYNIAKNDLFKINRSITGKGTLKTLKIIKKFVPKLQINKVKSRTKVYDWIVPPEWNVSEAYIKDKTNKKIIDMRNNNLHLMGYSVPVNKTLTKKDLDSYLYFSKKQPNAIPYMTSYYKKRWGFCISFNFKKYLDKSYKNNDLFHVVIKSKFNNNGFLNYGECYLKGKTKKEILISTYICHPSMANNELSGPIVSMSLINYLKKKKLNKSIRFLFIPETIGSITYLNKNLEYLKQNVIGGYNLSCIGDERNHSCMFSKYNNSPSDECIIEAYKKLKIKKYRIYSFLQRGSDERQYNSPGIDLPISSIFRTKYGEYPEYHTSLDNFDLVTLKGLKGGYNVAKNAINILQKKIIPENKILCEPNLGKRDLYPTLSNKNSNKYFHHYINFLQYSDGKNSLEKISRLIGLNRSKAYKIYLLLKRNNLIN